MRILSPKIFIILFIFAFGAVSILNFVLPSPQEARAAINLQINYQGKLTNASNVAVADGDYNMEFKLYDDPTAGSTLWTETRTGANKVTVTNGLFSVMLGSVSSLASVDFNQTVYLGVNIGGTGTPSWDGEMTPRKTIGSVPAAFLANGVVGTGGIRNTVSSTTALAIAKAGTDYALQVDTSAGSAATGLKVTSAAAAGGVALAAISSGTNENITIDAKGSGTISLGASSTGDVLFAGGSGSTGCTVTNSTGALACTAGGSFTTMALSGAITGATGITSSGTIQFSALTSNGPLYTSAGNGTLTTTAPTSGAIGYWSRSGTTLSQATANDILSLSGNSGDILTVASSATGSANKTISVSQTGATSGTDYAGYFSNTGAASTNIGLYATATGGTSNYSAIFEDGNVGIGTTTPIATLSLQRSGSDASYRARTYSNTNWQGNYLVGDRAEGTSGTPLPVTAGDHIVGVTANAYANSAFNFAGSFTFYVEGAPSGSNVPTYFTLWTTSASGSGERIHVEGGGEIGFNSSAPDRQLEINSASGANLRLTYNDADGSATNYADLLMSSGGDLSISPSGGDVDITGILNVNSLTTDTVGVTIASGQSYSGSGAVTLSSATATALTINSGTTGTINIGTDAYAETINIGNTGAAVKTIAIGNNTQANTITIGDASATGVSITDNNWSVSTAGAASFASIAVSGAVTGAASYNGLVVTANTGVVTTGTWNGTAVVDTYVADTLTVDSSSSVHWNALNNYPAACSAGSAISQLADTTNTCTAFNTDTSITLQDAYGAISGNTITTTDARNIAITLADVTTPTSLTIENQDTAATSAQRIFNSIASGTATNGLLIEQTGAGTMTNAIQIAETAGTITDGILITGTLGNILNSGSIDITGAGAITGATGITSSGNYIQSAGTFSLTSANTTQTTTSSAAAINVNSLTVGTGLYIASSSLTSGSLVDLQVSGSAGISSQKVINVATTGTITGTQTTYGGYFSNTHSGGTSTNVGLYVAASGGTNNYAAIFASGNVGVNTATPTQKLEVSQGNIKAVGVQTPAGFSGTATTGGSLATNNYYYAITAVDATGESSPTYTYVNVGGANNAVNLSWTASPLATSYNIYRSTSPGGAYVSYNTASTSFNDTGAAGGSSSPPVSNTAYGALQSNMGINVYNSSGLSLINSTGFVGGYAIGPRVNIVGDYFSFGSSGEGGGNGAQLRVYQGLDIAGSDNTYVSALNFKSYYGDAATFSAQPRSGQLYLSDAGSTNRFYAYPGVADGAAAVGYTLDTTNSLANASAKLLAVRNQGSEKLTVLANGNLGIGVSPTSMLHVVKSDNGTDEIAKFFANNLTQGIGINYNSILAIGSNTNQNISITPKGSGDIILTSGRTGVAYTPTSGTAALMVNGAAAVGSSTYLNVSAPTNGLIVEGSVGIGTSGPDRKLDVLDASDPQLRLTQADGSVYTDIQTDSSGYLNMTATGHRVRVVDNYNGANSFYVLNSTTGTSASNNVIVGQSTAGDQIFQFGYANTTNSIYGSDIGILTTGTGATGGILMATQANAPITFSTNGLSNPRLTILGTGQVGVSDASPSNALTVTGAASISSVLQVGQETVTTYSRLGAGTTGHTLGAADDLLISDDLEVDGDAWFDGNVTIAGTCTGCGGGATAFDAIADPSGNGAINMGTTVQTLDWGATTTTDNLSVTSSATGLTSGSAFKVTSATTGAVTNGIVQLAASGNYSGAGGLLNVTSSASTAGTLVNFTNNTASYTGTIQGVTANGLTTGTLLNLASSGSSQSTGKYINIAQTGVTTGYTGNLISLSSTSTTGAATFINLTANSSTVGVGQAISMTSQTSGTGLSITGGGANMTASGELIDLQMGAATVGSGLNITTSGVYTGAGILQLTANSATSGVIQQITANGLSTGSMLSLSSSGTAGATGQKGINVTLSGNNASGSQTTYGGYFSNTHGGSGTNVALYSTATTGTNNYAAIFDAGNVGIGTTSPATKLTVDSNSNSSSVRILGATEGTEIADIYVAANGRLLLDTTAGSAGQGFIELKGEDDEYGFILRDSTGVSTGYSNFYMNDTTNDYLNLCLNCTNAGATGLVVYDAGSGVMRVGVGTTGPDRKLDVLDASNPQLRLTQADGTVYGDLQSTTTANLIVTGDSLTSSSVKEYGLQISPTINQTSTASYTALDINVTETAATTANNLNRLADFRVGSSSKLAVANNGAVTLQNAASLTTAYGGFGKFENHLTKSEEFDHANWTKTSVSAPTANTQVAPDGSTTAESLATSGSGGYVQQDTSTAVSSTDYTFSVWVKSTGTQNFSMRIDGTTTGTGTEITHTATTSWQRFSVTQAVGGFTGNVRVRIYPGTSASTGTIYAWGAQVEKSSVPNTYAKTTIAGLTNDTSRGLVVNNNMLNTTASGYVYGGRQINTIDSTTAGTHIGQFIRMLDNTSLDSGQNVRGLEVQAYSGSNVNGTNTGIASYGYTFGIQAATTAQAAAQAAPAAIFADLDNGTDATTKARGNAIRAYTDNATSADLVSFYQETSTYTGNGLLMNFGNGGGSFSGNFMNLQNAATSKYTISSAGRHDFLTADADNVIPIYINSEESTVSQTLFAIESDTTGNGQSADTVKAHFEADGSLFVSLTGMQNTVALCHANNGQSNNDEIVDCSGAPSDVAEYFGSEDPTLTAGEIVIVGKNATEMHLDGYHTSKAWVARSTKAYQNTLMGVVSTAPAAVYGDEIYSASENPRPIALAGRVPVKVNSENGAIKAGDFITSSSTPGVGMKAVKAGPVIGQALNSFDGSGTGTVIVFIKATNYDGVNIDEQIAGLTFDYSDPAATSEISSQILEYLLDQLPNLDTESMSQIHTDIVIANGEIVSPNVTSQTLRTDFLSSATADGGLSVASTTMFNGGLMVDSIMSINDLIAFQNDVEFFGTPYFTSDTAGFAVIREGEETVDVEFSREYLVQPIVNASVSFEQTADLSSIEDEDVLSAMKSAQIAQAQSFLTDGISFAITNKTESGFTIVLSKPAVKDVKFSWIALAVRNANTFMSLVDDDINLDFSSDVPFGDYVGDSSNVLPEEPVVTEETQPAVAGDSTTDAPTPVLENPSDSVAQ